MAAASQSSAAPCWTGQPDGLVNDVRRGRGMEKDGEGGRGAGVQDGV